MGKSKSYSFLKQKYNLVNILPLPDSGKQIESLIVYLIRVKYLLMKFYSHE